MAAADKERYAAECKAAGIEPSAQKAKRAAAEEGEEGSAAPKKQKKEKKVEVEVVPAKDACHFFKVRASAPEPPPSCPRATVAKLWAHPFATLTAAIATFAGARS